MKRAASAPPVMLNVSGCPGRSASLAVTVVTAVVFSATLTAPPEVMAGVLSLTAVTVTAIAWVVLRLPSLTCTVTS